jgi:hypothetical protein
MSRSEYFVEEMTAVGIEENPSHDHNSRTALDIPKAIDIKEHMLTDRAHRERKEQILAQKRIMNSEVNGSNLDFSRFGAKFSEIRFRLSCL